MPSLAVLKVLLRELTTAERAERVPEPCLVMDETENAAAYAKAGTIDRVLEPVYVFNAANVCEVIRSGDLVLDLGCGPATQLAMVASLVPDARFLGVDLSQPMLDLGHKLIAERGITNTELREADITNISFLPDHSVDAVMSTLTLHHLPDKSLLDRTFQEVKRVLKPGGGVFILDFGRLHSLRSMHYFAHQYADRQSALFTEDYWNSLRAAFSKADYQSAVRPLAGDARLYSTFLAPYMMAVKSSPRLRDEAPVRARLARLIAALEPHQQVDLRDLSTFFRFGGLRSHLLA